MRRAEPALPLRHVFALGLMQGPAELLPVSSSAHTELLPWFAGWRYAELGGSSRKSFALALHAGAAVALSLDRRRELRAVVRGLDGARAKQLALSLTPAALAGAVLRPAIERYLGGPRSIALGLAGGGLAMSLADRRGGMRRGGARACADADSADALALGFAQALALAPGVSRAGATLTAARWRGFGREASSSLSWAVAWPVMLGASLLEALRLARSGSVAAEADRARLLLAATVAFGSTLASSRALRRAGYGGMPLLPYSVYRLLLAAAVVRRLRRHPLS